MKHQRHTMKKQNIVVTDKITCDRCDKDISMRLSSPDITNIEGGNLEVSYNWGSKHDCSTWKAELCDSCCDELKDWIGNGLQINRW